MTIEHRHSLVCSIFLSGQVRQLAAIEVRKRISANSGNLWLQVPQSDREQLKTQLPQIVVRELKRVSFSPIVPAFR